LGHLVGKPSGCPVRALKTDSDMDYPELTSIAKECCLDYCLAAHGKDIAHLEQWAFLSFFYRALRLATH